MMVLSTFTRDEIRSEPPSQEASTVVRARSIDTHLLTCCIANGPRQTLVNICSSIFTKHHPVIKFSFVTSHIHTIAAESVKVETPACITAACIRSNVVVAILVTAVNSKVTLINV